MTVWRKYEMPYIEYVEDEWSPKYIGGGGPYDGIPFYTVEQLSANPNGRGIFASPVTEEIHYVIIADPDCEFLGTAEAGRSA